MFTYHCPNPDCEDRGQHGFHSPDCEYHSYSETAIELAYIDILSRLTFEPMSNPELRRSVNDVPGREWSELHQECLMALWGLDHIEYNNDRDVFIHCEDGGQQASAHPTQEPLKTIHDFGTVDGAHDNGIFALIAWYSNQFDEWELVKQQLHEWNDRTNTFERGSFSETSFEGVLEKKKHIFDEEYGWRRMGREAKQQIDQYRTQHPRTTENRQHVS